MRKTVYTLDIGNYAPELTRLTFPLMRYYARRIGAYFHVIRDRKFPDWPVQCEKLQLHELGERRQDTFQLYFDADTLVHPELVDISEFLPRDHCANNARDMANVRWRYDRYFRRDGRNIGTCGWLIAAWDWTRDIWRFPDDLTVDEALACCTPTVAERNAPVDLGPRHLVDDFLMSRNVAKFGLKYTTLTDLWPTIGLANCNFFHHSYLETVEEKKKQMDSVLEQWKIPQTLFDEPEPPARVGGSNGTLVR